MRWTHDGRAGEACAMLTSLVIAATVLSLPAPPGPHPVGTRTLRLDDRARGRELVVQLWYPTAASGERALYFPEVARVADHLRALGGRAAAAADGLAALAGARAHAVEGAAPSGERLPLVLFSPGGNMSRHFYTGLAEGLASHGYAVAAISHPGVGLDVFPGGRVLLSEPRWNPPRGASAAERDAHFEPLSELLAADARFVLDRLLALEPKLDRDRVALAGHSRGGKTVSRACHRDARCKAALVLDNLPPAADRARAYRVPFLLVRAGGWEPEEVAAAATLRAAPLVAAVIEDAAHMSFSDSGLTDPARFQAKLPAARGLAVTVALARAFLDRHLRGVESRFPDIGLPEVTVSSRG
jgi:dienelactone hydrolase